MNLDRLFRRPKFSIITVTYNAGDVLEETIASVAAQTYRWVEYIVVDGGSSDATLEIAERWRRPSGCVDLILHGPDKGLYDAMNKGLQVATGDYVSFLNAGDTLHACDTLERMMKAVNRERKEDDALGFLPDVLYGQTAIVDVRRRFLRWRHLEPPYTLTWKSYRRGMLVCHQAFFVRRKLAPSFDLQYRYSADYDWCIRVMKRMGWCVNTQQHLIDYLDGGLTTRHRFASLWERFRIMGHYYGWVSTLLRHVGFVFRALWRMGLRTLCIN